MKELRTVDTKAFECGGIKWTLSDKPSFARYAKLQELNIEFTFSQSVIDFYKGLELVEKSMNKTEFVKASSQLYNLKRGVAEIDKKQPVAFRMCALFINQEGEDLTDASDELMSRKVEIWAKELDCTPFFHLAASICREWIAAYNSFSRSSSESEEKAEDTLTSKL